MDAEGGRSWGCSVRRPVRNLGGGSARWGAWSSAGCPGSALRAHPLGSVSPAKPGMK